MPCSRQKSYQQAFPTWIPAWPTWIEITSLIEEEVRICLLVCLKQELTGSLPFIMKFLSFLPLSELNQWQPIYNNEGGHSSAQGGINSILKVLNIFNIWNNWNHSFSNFFSSAFYWVIIVSSDFWITTLSLSASSWSEFNVLNISYELAVNIFTLLLNSFTIFITAVYSTGTLTCSKFTGILSDGACSKLPGISNPSFLLPFNSSKSIVSFLFL